MCFEQDLISVRSGIFVVKLLPQCVQELILLAVYDKQEPELVVRGVSQNLGRHRDSSEQVVPTLLPNTKLWHFKEERLLCGADTWPCKAFLWAPCLSACASPAHKWATLLEMLFRFQSPSQSTWLCYSAPCEQRNLANSFACKSCSSSCLFE